MFVSLATQIVSLALLLIMLEVVLFAKNLKETMVQGVVFHVMETSFGGNLMNVWDVMTLEKAVLLIVPCVLQIHLIKMKIYATNAMVWQTELTDNVMDRFAIQANGLRK